MRSNYLPFLALLGLLFFTSCERKIPKDIIPKKAMAEVLYEVHFTEALLQEEKIKDPLVQQAYYAGVFKKHHMTKEKFDASVQWYGYHTEILNEVYDEVLNKIDAEDVKIQGYYYHPEFAKELDTIQEIDLWNTLFNRDTIVRDSVGLSYNMDHSEIVSVLDSVEWNFKMKAYSDTLQEATTALVIQLDTFRFDTLSTSIKLDTIRKNFHIFKVIPDSIQPMAFQLYFLRTTEEQGDSIWIELREVTFKGWYNRIKHPINQRALKKYKRSLEHLYEQVQVGDSNYEDKKRIKQ